VLVRDITCLAQVVLGRSADVRAPASSFGPPGGERGPDPFPACTGEGAGIRAVSRHVSVVASSRLRFQGTNEVKRGRLGIRQEQTDSLTSLGLTNLIPQKDQNVQAPDVRRAGFQRLRKWTLLAPQSMPVSTGLGTDIRIGT
jgi:hypothetical protein